jgi:hypothetical protein
MPLQKQVGKTSLKVPPIVFGSAPIANMCCIASPRNGIYSASSTSIDVDSNDYT